MSKYTKYIAIGLLILFLITSLISCSSASNSSSNLVAKTTAQNKKMGAAKSAKYCAPATKK